MVPPIVIAGPTACGKSSYALELAKQVNGEIICADSRQIFAGMRIGTASPTDEERARIPHHGYEAIDPNTDYDAGQFIVDTDAYIAEIQSRNKVPILVGGTGLYLRAWRFGLTDVPQKNDQIREDLKSRNDLHDELARVDPDSALLISPADQVRLVRALEIFFTTGKKPSELRQSHSSAQPRVSAEYRLLWPTKEWLAPRIEARVRQMFDQNIVQEACKLREHVDGAHLHLLKTMAYEEALQLADGDMSREQAIERTVIRHRQYAKRQMTWFQKEDWWTRYVAACSTLYQQPTGICARENHS